MENMVTFLFIVETKNISLPEACYCISTTIRQDPRFPVAMQLRNIAAARSGQYLIK